MKYFYSLSRVTRICIIATVILLAYGYLCRAASIYFFWESEPIGWILFWITALMLLRQRIKTQKSKQTKAIPEKIGFGLVILILLVKSVFIIVLPQTAIYKSAVTFINKDARIKQEVGTINNIVLIPAGSVNVSDSANVTTGQADLNFIIKGTQKYIELNLEMYKEGNTDWNIEIAN